MIQRGGEDKIREQDVRIRVGTTIEAKMGREKSSEV